MRPLTRTVPKPALPVLGRPMILLILEQLRRLGIGRAVVNLHHLPQVLPDLVASAPPGRLPEVTWSWEAELLGTGGGIRNAARWLRGEGTILVRNADFLADLDLAAAVAAHRASGLPVTLVLAESRPGYSVLDVAADGHILSLAGIPPVEDRSRVAGRYLFTGIHLVEEEILDQIPEGTTDIVRETYRPLAAKERLGSYVHRGLWREFGTPREYLDGTLALLAAPAAARAAVAGDAALLLAREGNVVVGPGAEVARDCRLEDTVVMDGARIGPGADLRRVLVGPGAFLPPGFRAADALVGAGDPPEVLPL